MNIRSHELYSEEIKEILFQLMVELDAEWSFELDNKVHLLLSSFYIWICYNRLYISFKDKECQKSIEFREMRDAVKKWFYKALADEPQNYVFSTNELFDLKSVGIIENNNNDPMWLSYFNAPSAYVFALASYTARHKYNNLDLSYFFLNKASKVLDYIAGAYKFQSKIPKNISMQSKGGLGRAAKYDEPKRFVLELWGTGHDWRYIVATCCNEVVRQRSDIPYTSARKWIDAEVRNQRIALR